jgi:branched-chain amino acid transport system permease protein
MFNLLLKNPKLRAAGLIALIGALCLLPFFADNKYYLHIFIFIFLNIIWAGTLRLIWTTGQIAFGHGAFVGLGGFSSAALALSAGLPVWLCIILGGLVGLICAILLGYSSMRVKSTYFTVITWGFGEMLVYVYLRMKEPFGGAAGLNHIPQPANFTIPLLNILVDWNTKVPYYFAAMLLMLISVYILYRLEKSRYGLIFASLLQGDIVAQSVGVNLIRYKVLAFAIACFLASIAGAFYSTYASAISTNDVSTLLTIMLGCYILVGGMNMFGGFIIGVVLLIIVGELLSGYAVFKSMFYAALIVIVLMFGPEGLVGLPTLFSTLIARLRKRIAPGGQSNA